MFFETLKKHLLFRTLVHQKSYQDYAWWCIIFITIKWSAHIIIILILGFECMFA